MSLPYSDGMAAVVIVNGIGDNVVAFRGALVRDLVARGHTVTVSTPTPIEVDPAGVARAIQALGARCVFSPLDRAGLNPMSERRARAHYDMLFRELRPDAVFVSNPKPIFHAIPAARAAGVARRVAMVTGLGYAFTGSSFKARVLRAVATRLYRRALAEATAVFFQNPDDRDELASRGALAGAPTPRLVAGSGVDVEAFAAAPAASGPPVFLMVARLLGDKGVREYAEAARLVRAERPAWRFRLAGWIDANPAAIRREELDAWVRAGAIEYAGRLDDVRDEFACASVFVLPSYREGTPKSTLEALATARPVITTDAIGCRETIRDGVEGLLVRPRDAQALAHACLRLGDDAALRAAMGARARERAVERFDVRQVNAEIIEALGA
jgi:glycosyltransferase involved in cell wall biosynthesis